MATQDRIRDPRFDRDFDASHRDVVGLYPIPEGSKVRSVECSHCSETLGISAWDYLNGFLVVCPHCRGWHGKPWGFQRTLLAGFFFNALSFFFTMRPRRAVAMIALFVIVCWGLASLAINYEDVDAFMIAAVGTLVLGPVLINAVVLVRHQMRLDAAPPSGGRREA